MEASPASAKAWAKRHGEGTWAQARSGCSDPFCGMDRDGLLRQPVFLGLRQDKAAADVTREKKTRSDAAVRNYRGELATGLVVLAIPRHGRRVRTELSSCRAPRAASCFARLGDEPDIFAAFGPDLETCAIRRGAFFPAAWSFSVPWA